MERNFMDFSRKFTRGNDKYSRILLHTCCAPCTVYPLRRLKNQGFETECYFFNPNIYPQKEHNLRLKTLLDFSKREKVKTITECETVTNDEFNERISKFSGIRCLHCYGIRIEMTAKKAAEIGFGYFTSTLLYSKYQKHSELISICKKFASIYGVRFYYEDFRIGWYDGIKESKEMNMYRQKYCGCQFSYMESKDTA